MKRLLDSCLVNRIVLDCVYKLYKLGQCIDVLLCVDPPTNDSSTNPFWISSVYVKIISDKPLPKSNYPISYV